MALFDAFGMNVETITFGRHSVTIWDFGGDARIRPLWRKFFWQAHAFVFVLDTSAPARFADAREELHRMCREDCVAASPVLVLINKIDAVDAVDLVAIAQALDIDTLMVTHLLHKHIARVDMGKKSMEASLHW
ncbi:ADP-ribosylation factor family-domain-containing protein [Mycena crocata]|nr:ADP-ribosylation factor family-domain-containing protein [Mycena crocata]